MKSENTSQTLSPKVSPGALRRISLNDEEMYHLLEVFSSTFKTSTFDVLFNLFEDKFLFFLDLFEGETFTIPKRKDIERLISYSKIYAYIKSRGFSEESIIAASKINEIPILEVEKIKAIMDDCTHQ